MILMTSSGASLVLATKAGKWLVMFYVESKTFNNGGRKQTEGI